MGRPRISRRVRGLFSRWIQGEGEKEISCLGRKDFEWAVPVHSSPGARRCKPVTCILPSVWKKIGQVSMNLGRAEVDCIICTYIMLHILYAIVPHGRGYGTLSVMSHSL